MADGNEEGSEESIKLPQTKAELRAFAIQQQLAAMKGVQDRLTNTISPSLGYRELRKMGATEIPSVEDDFNNLLDRLSLLDNAVNETIGLLASGQELRTRDIEGEPELDLKSYYPPERHQPEG